MREQKEGKNSQIQHLSKPFDFRNSKFEILLYKREREWKNSA
jgi:hypothetical protein